MNATVLELALAKCRLTAENGPLSTAYALAS